MSASSDIITSSSIFLRSPSPAVSDTLEAELVAKDDSHNAFLALRTEVKECQAYITKLKAKDKNWVNLFTQVEKGMAIKFAELDSFKTENQDLKVNPLEVTDVEPEYQTITRTGKVS
jgi:hypothetical protein